MWSSVALDQDTAVFRHIGVEMSLAGDIIDMNLCEEDGSFHTFVHGKNSTGEIVFTVWWRIGM